MKPMGWLVLAVMFRPLAAVPQETGPVDLPRPCVHCGNPLYPVFMKRRSSRQFSSAEIPARMLSELLWSAFGVNDPPSGKRTAPSAYDWREIDVYVSTAGGLFKYDAPGNRLIRILDRDIRPLTGTQRFVGEAPLNLVYVADFKKMASTRAGVDDAKRMFLAAADAGAVSQNVSLYCASAGLNAVVRDWMDREALGREMALRPEQKIILAQTVGFPKSKK
jgi:hypothetical protein